MKKPVPVATSHAFVSAPANRRRFDFKPAVYFIESLRMAELDTSVVGCTLGVASSMSVNTNPTPAKPWP